MRPLTPLVAMILGILFILSPLSVCGQSSNAQLLEQAQTSLERGDLAGAAAQLEQALALDQSRKNSAELYKRLALIEYLMQRFDRFDEHIREAIRLDPLDADARYQLGRRFFEEKRYREAMVEFQEALKLQ